jgi:hypothetical protein
MASGIVLTGHNYYLVLGPAVCSSVSYAPKLGRASAHQFANNGAKAVYICDFSDTHLATHKREMNLMGIGL